MSAENEETPSSMLVFINARQIPASLPEDSEQRDRRRQKRERSRYCEITRCTPEIAFRIERTAATASIVVDRL